MKELKILHLITDLDSGGAEMMLYKLLANANRKQFESVVVSLLGPGRLNDHIEALGIPIYTVMRTKKPTFTAIYQLIRTIRKTKPDIIQGWMYHGNLSAQLASMFLPQRTPVIWSIHHSIYSLSYEKKTTAAIIKFSAYLSKFAARVIFVSQTSQIQHKGLGYSMKDSCIIPNGFDTSLFIPSTQARVTTRSDLGVPQDAPLIGLIGRFHPMKDHPTFLQAAALLLETHPGAHFLLVGKEIDWQNQILCRLVKELGLSDRIYMLGERSDMPDLMAALDIASSSSYSEAFPLAVGEAMSCGIPCVVTDVGDSALIVGNTGIIVPPRDSQALAHAWAYLIDAGPDVRRRLGQAARERIQHNYSLDSIVRNYENLYMSVAHILASDPRATDVLL